MVLQKDKNAKLLILVAVAAVVLLLNQWQIMALSDLTSGGVGSSSKGTKLNVKLSGDVVQDAIKAVVPTGTPLYGAELAVSFDDPVNSLNILEKLDRQIPIDSLSEDEKARFINVGT
ncbi:MAG: hypothetical protein AABX60_01055, partial [Nanoarchaeota archaeon]